MNFLPMALNAAATVASGYLSGRGQPGRSKMDKTKQKLIDQLLSSINGGGPYSDIFNVNEETFQKSYVEPAMARFNNQIAPQIQQKFLASGQQGNTGMQNYLTQAGVDLNQLLNQQYGIMQENAMNRKQNTINSILGQASGGQAPLSTGQSLAQAGSGFLSSEGFSDQINKIFKNNQNQASASANPFAPNTRPGFTPEWSDWKLGDQRWGS